jgi:tetratricopeptide (TPR) repeat protein
MAGNQVAFQKAMNQGHSAAWDQDWQKAALYYGQAIEEFPENPLALSSLGLAYYEMRDFERSLDCYQHAARVAPGDPVPQEKVARIYERQGHLKEAAEASLQAAELHLHSRATERALDNWKHVLDLYPEHLVTRQRMAAVYERLGRLDESVHEYVAAASILQRNGDLTRALKAAEYAVRLRPESQEARFALHTLRSNQMLPRPARPSGVSEVAAPAVNALEEGSGGGQGMDAVEEARQKALGQLAELVFEQTDEGNGELGARRGLNALARGLSGQSNEASSGARIVLHLGQAIESQHKGDAPQAIAELERAQELGLRSPAVLFILGDLYATQDVEKALRSLWEAGQNPEYALGASLLRARLEHQQSRLNDAAGDYLRALSLADAATAPAGQAEDLQIGRAHV